MKYKLNYKLIVGLLVFAIGVYLIIFSIISMHDLAEAKGFSQNAENFFTHNPDWWNPIIKFFGGKAQEKLEEYDLPVMICLIAGIIMTIGGAVTAIVYGRKKTL